MPERRPRAGAFLAHRARAQWPLLAAVFATLVACSSLVGVSALLLTEGQHRALAAAVADADGVEGSGSPDLVTALMALHPTEEGAPEGTSALVAAVTSAMTDAVRPYSATTSVWASSPMMFLRGAEVRQGYLLDADSATAHGNLTAGRWPAEAPAGSPLEVAIPAATAAELALSVGRTVQLSISAPRAEAPPRDGVDVVVVGIFTPDGTSSWTRDVLAGDGYRAVSNGVPAYGPFLVAPRTLIDADRPIARVSVVLDPTLSGDPDGLPGVVRSVEGLKDQFAQVVGERLESGTVSSDLGGMLARDRAEQNLTAAIVLVVVVLVLAIGFATLGLVGRLVVQRRATETEMLIDRGASRAQLAGRAAVEALALAVLAAAVAAPLALAAYRGLVALPPLGPSWRGAAELGAPTLGWAVVAAVVLGAVAPSAALVGVALRGGSARRGRRAARAFARSGADLLLLAVAVLGYFQLRAHRIGTGAIDPILVVAPVLCLVAGAVLALRALPVIARVAEVRARRGTGLVLPLAGWQVARGRATSGAFLMVLAASAAAFGVVFLGTWHASQGDQADASVGTDLAVGEAGVVDTDARLAEVTGGVVVPVTKRGITLGSRPGGAELVALDTTRAAEVMRGRLPDGETWASRTEGLAPEAPAAALTVTGGGTGVIRLTFNGEVGGTTPDTRLPIPAHVFVTPTVILVDDWGNRVALAGPTVALDGTPREVAVPAQVQEPLPQGTWRVIAIDLELGLLVDGGLRPEYNSVIAARISIDIAGADARPGQWYAVAVGQEPVIQPLSTKNDGTTVTAIVGASVFGLGWTPAHLMLLSFKPADSFPVLVSHELARDLDLSPGDSLGVTTGAATVTATVAGSVPFVPGTPHGVVVLADSDALGRALLAAGSLAPITDVWWVGSPEAGTEAEVATLGLGPVETPDAFASDLRDGPLRVALRVALALLIGAALVLAVVGTAAHAAAVAETRATEIARLRGIGVSRRALFATGVLQHAAVTVVAVAVGGMLGALLAWIIGPLLVVGQGGLPAVPYALVVWPLAALGGTLLALVAGGTAVGIPAVRALVGRDAALGLRMGGER